MKLIIAILLINLTASSMNGQEKKMEVATLGGGCFWCIEAVFQRIEGVEKVVSGYSGGTVKNPTYEQVCEGTTGHAEVVQVTFDPQKISFAEILDVFWHAHNPTTLNRQGNDVGTQYRSVIFYHDERQKEIALKSIAESEKSGLWSGKYVTEVSPFKEFYVAEDYHQNYYNRVGNRNPYCTVVISPKVQKLQKEYKHKLKKEYAE
jgi:peptide-methionine (S)-S-oxide reductase